MLGSRCRLGYAGARSGCIGGQKTSSITLGTSVRIAKLPLQQTLRSIPAHNIEIQIPVPAWEPVPEWVTVPVWVLVTGTIASITQDCWPATSTDFGFQNNSVQSTCTTAAVSIQSFQSKQFSREFLLCLSQDETHLIIWQFSQVRSVFQCSTNCVFAVCNVPSWSVLREQCALECVTCNFFWYMSCFKQGWMYVTPRNNKYLGLGCFMLLITS